MKGFISILSGLALLSSIALANLGFASADSALADYLVFYDYTSDVYIDYSAYNGTGASIPVGGNGNAYYATGDTLYIGSSEPFSGVEIVIDESRPDGEYTLSYFEMGGTFWNEIDDAVVTSLDGTVTFTWDYSDWGWDETWQIYEYDAGDLETQLNSSHQGYFVKLETTYYSEEEGYATASEVYVLDENSTVTTTSEESSEDTTVVSSATFSDVTSTHQNFAAIEYLVSIGTLEGYGDGYFKPSNTVNRAELMKILVAGQGISPDEETYYGCFPDVGTDWYAKYVCYAESQGWVDGYPDGYFYPGNTVNKVEAVKMVVNALGLDSLIPSSVDSVLFADTDSAQWYAGYLYVAKWLNLLDVTSTSNNFGPGDGMDRGWVSEYVFRAWVVNEMGASMYDAEIRDSFFSAMEFEIDMNYNDDVDTPSDDDYVPLTTDDTTDSNDSSTEDDEDYVYLDLTSSSIDENLTIENMGDSTVNLDGYSLETSSTFYEFGSYELAPGESIEIDYYFSGETVYLRNDSGAIVESDYNF